jgi:hypothetical protein
MIVASFGCYVAAKLATIMKRPSGRMEAPPPGGLVERAVGRA